MLNSAQGSAKLKKFVIPVCPHGHFGQLDSDFPQQSSMVVSKRDFIPYPLCKRKTTPSVS